MYIHALLETLDNLVDFWAPEEPSLLNGTNNVQPTQPGASRKKAIIIPTRESQDIGRLNATTVINLEGMVTRVRAIQVKKIFIFYFFFSAAFLIMGLNYIFTEILLYGLPDLRVQILNI